MERKDWNRIGIAAAILLAPGGFILGATLVVSHYRRKAQDKAATPAPSDPESGGTPPKTGD